MCYSAQIEASFRQYERMFGAQLDLPAFFDLYAARAASTKVKVPKAVDAAFTRATDSGMSGIREAIRRFEITQAAALEQELFKQRTRLADAERTLQTKMTKAASESQRIASDKITATLRRLDDLRRDELKDRDSRIFPGVYAPVVVMEHGRRVIKPMRYQCRPAGKPANYDARFPSTYNARRDNLEKFWKGQFGVTHGLMIVNAFYENVSRARLEHRELGPDEKDENVVLEFRPDAGVPMLVACLWSHWTGAGQPDLLSFAAITDEPPPEVSAAGHDRCIIPIKAANVDAWLNPSHDDLQRQFMILDDRERPYYAHRLAA
ncbi:SOS response-associated peptidase [Pandoraea commovens]|uniref:Abasic site processing protein n=1 Tax=Pandoraea commovens TaxID=2508289 RepID=A0ABY5Q9G9_9BURK|nr:SOS response-associated peptidase [Pandoraea commovens]UVA77137.1 SOS response-associated peptidase [Pandoraea commovens]